jgi:ribosome-binding protein aMBF1 (putative translation factor)
MQLSDRTGTEQKEWRESRAWQRSWLAAQLGVSPSAMRKWEQPQAFVPLIVVIACEALDARMEQLKKTSNGD